MSARLVEKDNIYIMGLYKNASQSVKQIYKQHEGWTIIEDKFHESLDLYDSKNKIYIPVRPELNRHESGIIQDINSTMKIKYPEFKIDDDINSAAWEEAANREITLLQKRGWEIESFKNHPDHFTNSIGSLFLEEILGNDDWNGIQVYYFDMKYFSSHLPKYLGLDIKIPFNNTRNDLISKRKILKMIKESWGNMHMQYHSISFNTMEKYRCREFIWKTIRKSKHWINLENYGR